jgi:hypothetical protein
MSNRTRRGPATRTEARRRSRQIERGADLPVEDLEPEDPAAKPAAGGGILGRIFPAAPPLPNRPDPLAGFGYDGPFRSILAGIYLLGRHPRAWLLPALPWAAAQTLAYLIPPTFSAIQIPMVLVSVFAIIAAGWIGWERPWAFGLVATITGTVIEATFLALLFGTQGITTFTPGQVFLGIIVFQIAQLQWILGAFIGWYGGYLRRRMAVNTPQPARGRRRR